MHRAKLSMIIPPIQRLSETKIAASDQHRQLPPHYISMYILSNSNLSMFTSAFQYLAALRIWRQ